MNKRLRAGAGNGRVGATARSGTCGEATGVHLREALHHLPEELDRGVIVAEGRLIARLRAEELRPGDKRGEDWEELLSNSMPGELDDKYSRPEDGKSMRKRARVAGDEP